MTLRIAWSVLISAMMVAAPQGSQRITGSVVDVSGRPIAGAHVRLLGTRRPVQSDVRGHFAIDSVPPGLQVVEARHIGFTTATVSVDVSSSSAAHVTITLKQSVRELDTVRVGPVVDSAAIIAPRDTIARPKPAVRKP